MFLNVCASPSIPPPPPWSPPPPCIPPHVLDYLTPAREASLSESDRRKAEEFLAIPLYFSQSRPDEDHQGQRCTVMDVIVFPDALMFAQDARPFKSYLIHLVLEQASEVLGPLDLHYKLPKMRSKGTPEPFRLDQILHNSKKGMTQPTLTQTNKVTQLEEAPLDKTLVNYRLTYLGSPTVDCAQICLDLDESYANRLLQDPRFLRLTISGYSDQLEVAAYEGSNSVEPMARQMIPINLGIDVEKSTAVLDGRKKTVTILLPLCSYKSLKCFNVSK